MSVFSNSITYSFGGAFSMGLSKRKDLYNADSTPGPGTYHDETITVTSPRQPQYVISRSPRRPIFEEKGVPPPGAYEVNSDMGKGQKVSISKNRNKETGDKFDVGPGSYEITKGFANKQSAPQFSFSSRYEEGKPPMQTPGPGTYNMPDTFLEKFMLSKSTMNTNNSDTLKRYRSEEILKQSSLPGPGEYYHEEPVLQKGKGTTFAKSGRMIIKQSDTPGPGQFKVTSQLFANSKNFTLGSKISINDKYKSSVPGPGTYDLSQNMRKPTIKMGASLRTGLVMSDTPGPGSYLNEDTKDDSFAGQQPQNRGLGYSKRPNLIQSNRAPGPGNYNLPEYMGKSTHVKISTNANKGKWKVKSEVPGPGSYNVNNDSIDLTKGARIKGKRRDNDNSIAYPGPGSYDVSFNAQSPKYSFTLQKRNKQDIRQLFEPSPGQYEIAGTIANVPSYLHQKRS